MVDQEFSVEEIKTFSFTLKNLYFLKLHNDPGKMIIVLRGNLVGEQCRPEAKHIFTFKCYFQAKLY